MAINRTGTINPKAHQARRALAQLLSQPATYGSVAFLGLCDLFPPEWFQWEPKTVQLEIASELNVKIEPDVFDKIMAAREVVTSDAVFNELPVFITLCNALNGDGVDTPVAQPMEPADLSWAVLEICLLYPPTEKETFSEEIIGYIEETLKWMGVRGLPNVLVNFLPEPMFDDAQATDPDTMEGFFTKLTDINDEVLSNLAAWRYQLSQLKLTEGTTESILEMFEKVK